jgi:hypothetical protein
VTRQFADDPETIWLSEPGSDRNMALLQDFWFIDRQGRRWDAPKASVIDGASIPRPLWSLIGSPYTGDYRRASIVHDVACDQAGTDPVARRAADRMFFEACRAGGCSIRDATLLYIGVRIGAWWGEAGGVGDASAVRLTHDLAEAPLQQDFQAVSEDVLRPGEADDPDEVEARTDAALAAHAARKMRMLATTRFVIPQH